MSLNPEVTKQAQEIVFSRKSQEVTHPTVYFNNSPVTQSSSQKHLGIKEKFPKPTKVFVLVKN